MVQYLLARTVCHLSHVNYGDHGDVHTVRFPSAVRTKAARRKLPVALHLGLSRSVSVLVVG